MIRLVLLIALLVPIGVARADQSDSRLDLLFQALERSEDRELSRTIEEQIWSIWGTIDDPASAELLERGSFAMASRDLAGALDSFDVLVATEPDFAEAWNKRATVYYLLGRFEDSIADIGRTLALEPRHFGALSGLGLIMMRLDKPKMALESFQAALELHPHLPAANAHVGELLERVKGAPL